jgi:hypothetical protein
MSFIRLTDLEDIKVYVNPERIVAMREVKEGVFIVLPFGPRDEGVTVKETIQQVVELADAAGTRTWIRP